MSEKTDEELKDDEKENKKETEETPQWAKQLMDMLKPTLEQKQAEENKTEIPIPPPPIIEEDEEDEEEPPVQQVKSKTKTFLDWLM